MRGGCDFLGQRRVDLDLVAADLAQGVAGDDAAHLGGERQVAAVAPAGQVKAGHVQRRQRGAVIGEDRAGEAQAFAGGHLRVGGPGWRGRGGRSCQ